VPIVTQAINAKPFAFYFHCGLERSTQGLDGSQHDFSGLLLFLVLVGQVGEAVVNNSPSLFPGSKLNLFHFSWINIQHGFCSGSFFDAEIIELVLQR